MNEAPKWTTPVPPAWPPGGGEMARRIRAHDWAATPLGPMAVWPTGLRVAVRLLLGSRHPMFIWWGPELVQLYNDAYRETMGPEKHPSALGASGRETWAEIWDTIGPQIEQVMAGGAATWHEDQFVPVTRHDGRQEVWWTYGFSPIDDERALGGVGGVLVICRDVTREHLAEQALREGEARQAFLLKLSDAHQPLADAAEIQATTTRMLGAHLGADRVMYAEVEGEPGAEAGTIRGQYVRPARGNDPPAVPFPERFTYRPFGAHTMPARYRGELLVVADVTEDPRFDTSQRAAWAVAHVRAAVVAPLAKGGRLVAEFGVHCTGPRAWTDAEAALVREVAERTWAAAERARAEAALRESEEKYRTVFESMDEGFLVHEMIRNKSGQVVDYRLLEANPAHQRATGLPRETIGKLGSEFMPEVEPYWLELFHRVSTSGVTERVEMCNAPTSRWYNVQVSPVRGHDRIAIVFDDVTTRKRAEAALRESEERFRGFAENSADVLWIADRTGTWLEYLSPAFERVFGEGRDRVMADLGRWAELVHPEDREAVSSFIPRALAGEVAIAHYRVVRPADGRVVHLRDTGFPIRDAASGAITQIAGIVQDITDLARGCDELEALVAARTGELLAAEASLRQAQKMEAVGQLTGGIAHDFNNMLQGISSSLELVRRRAGQGRLAEAGRYVESAHETVRRAAALTHRLLAFSRQQALDPEPVNLDELVTGMAELIRRTVGPQVQVEVRLGDGAWPVLCDESQLENALLNLCVNARDAMPDGGWLTISTEEAQLTAADLAGEEGLSPGLYAVLAVTDTGTGMDEATQARVFEPFFTTKPLGQGTGLGLSQVYGFVRQSGGLVRLDSAPGEGTTVRLFLPRHETVSAGERDSTGTADVVLLVEDEEGLRAMAAEWLREAGLRVLEAPDGAAALRLLQGAAGWTRW